MYICPVCCGVGSMYNITKEPSEYVCVLCKGGKFIGGDVYYNCIERGKIKQVIAPDMLEVDVDG